MTEDRSKPANPPSPEVLEAYSTFFAKRGAVDEDGLAELCAQRPELAEALQALFASHTRGRRRPEPATTRRRDEAAPVADASAEATTAWDPLPAAAAGDGGEADAFLDRLREHRSVASRYVDKDEVGRGGMGVIRRVWDADLRRDVAMKLCQSPPGAATNDQDASLGRFLEEAQITGQLDHPSIVPVHELGLDADGNVYFTMPLIRGRSLGEVLQLDGAEAFEWTLTRILNVVLKVCEAVAFAHSRGVVHRDLKPDNIMVGPFGETYVMDWGLARVVDGDDAGREADARVATDRGELRESGADSALLTLDDDIVGTPAYMAPEQAQGDAGSAADIYAIGALLYRFLAKRPPYTDASGKTTAFDVLRSLRDGPPVPLAELAPDAPRPLIDICEKAMAREPRGRYADALGLARDLEAYLENRPTTAGHPGPLALLKLAMRRHREAMLALAGTFVLLVGLTVAFIFYQQRQAALQLRVLDFMTAQALRDQLEAIYPIHPASLPQMRLWRERADTLLAREGAYRTEHDAGAATAPPTGRERAEMLANMQRLRTERENVLAATRLAIDVQRLSVVEARAAWDEAIASVESLPAYAGVELVPIVGLVPLRRDPESGLWEFWHVASGSRPVVDASGSGYRLAADSGIVLVLLPGGEFTVGSPLTAAVRYANEEPAALRLAPFFLAKHEVTQAQWATVMHGNPSSREPGDVYEGVTFTALHPVEQVSWHDCARFVSRLGLRLPTEVQWEYACRAGRETAYHWGDDAASLEQRDNVHDESAPAGLAGTAPWNDGYANHAPVGTFAANRFGIHDLHGNVSEWCRDVYAPTYGPFGDEPTDGDVGAVGEERVFRGGSWYLTPAYCRSAFRQRTTPGGRNQTLGLRVAMPLSPAAAAPAGATAGGESTRATRSAGRAR